LADSFLINGGDGPEKVEFKNSKFKHGDGSKFSVLISHGFLPMIVPLSVFWLSLLVLCPDAGQSLLQKTTFLLKTNRHVCFSSSVPTEGSDNKKGGLLPPWLPSFATAATGGLLFGSDIGSSSSVVRILGSNGAEFGDLSALQLGQIASSSLFGAMVASATLIFVGDQKIGRKLELQMASVLFLIGTIVQSSSPNLPVEFIGRIIYGLGIGTAMHVAPLYIAETSPNDLRGKLVSLKEAAIVAGIVLGYAAGVLFTDWRDVFKASLPFEALMLIGAFFLVPESARWLALRNRPDEAAVALAKCQGLSLEDAQRQVVEMTKMTMTAAKADATPTTEDESVLEKLQDIFASPYNRQALTIGVGLVLFQQLSGQPSVLVSSALASTPSFS
jgi:MFS family permease